MVLLLVLAMVSLVFGAFSLTNATLGVGAIAGACAFGIMARIVQADAHHKAVVKASAPVIPAPAVSTEARS